VQRLIRRVQTFGFPSRDARPAAAGEIHHRVIGQGLDDPQWMTRTPAERHDLLVQAIERDTGFRVELDALGKRTLGVFEAILQARHRYGRDAIGYYVVSGTEGADDVLAPLLLARWAEAYDRNFGRGGGGHRAAVRILRGARALRHRHADPAGRSALPPASRLARAHAVRGDRLLDANKVGGLCAARHAAYRAQAELSAALAAAHEHHVIFHARGGSIARGGGRVDSLVRTAPAGTVNGTLRLTEQGEVINQGYGLRPIAMRTLERAFQCAAHRVGGGNAGKYAEPEQQQFAAVWPM
jgi:phosphoenolpyruvate carboxylase